MPAIVRQFDINSAGGAVLSGRPDFIVSGKPAATVGMPVSPHTPCPIVPTHCAAFTMLGNNSFKIGNRAASMVTNPDTCGHPRVTGDFTFLIGR